MKMNFANPAQSYVTPEIEVAEVISEGVLCQSGGTPATDDWDFDQDIIG